MYPNKRFIWQAYQLFFGLLRRLKKAVFANTSVSVLLMDKYSPLFQNTPNPRRFCVLGSVFIFWISDVLQRK